MHIYWQQYPTHMKDTDSWASFEFHWRNPKQNRDDDPFLGLKASQDNNENHLNVLKFTIDSQMKKIINT